MINFGTAAGIVPKRVTTDGPLDLGRAIFRTLEYGGTSCEVWFDFEGPRKGRWRGPINSVGTNDPGFAGAGVKMIITFVDRERFTDLAEIGHVVSRWRAREKVWIAPPV